MTLIQPKFKKHVSSFTLRLGPLTTVGSLVGVRKPQSKYDAGKYVNVTQSGVPVKQLYVDENGAVVKNEDILKAKPEKVGVTENNEAIIEYHIVDKEQVKEIKKNVLPKNVLSLQVHDQKEVDNKLFPSDSNGYVFIPDNNDPVNVQMYDVIREGLSTDKAFVGMGNIRGFDTFARVYIWRGQIVVQKALYPEDVNDHEVIDTPSLPDTTKAKVATMLSKLQKPFNVEDYRNVVKEQLAELEDTSDGIDVIVSPSGAVTFDLEAMLDEYL